MAKYETINSSLKLNDSSSLFPKKLMGTNKPTAAIKRKSMLSMAPLLYPIDAMTIIGKMPMARALEKPRFPVHMVSPKTVKAVKMSV
jgi:hypothetical protein